MNTTKAATILTLVGLAVCLTVSGAWARADKTTYPVVFAHGMLGFDQFLGIDYFGSDYGVFVGDPCDRFLETSCNRNIDRNQQAYATDVNPFQSSEYRGLELADDIEGYLATVGANGVNIIGHSQGGVDARKAARLLYDRMGHRVVHALISISSPHRGSSVSKNVLENGEDGFNAFVSFLAGGVASSLFYVEQGDYFASMKAFYYDDWDPEDGEITGCKAFNATYPVNSDHVKYYGSLITADQGGLGPVLLFLGLLAPLDIDGDGWCGATDSEGNLLDCQGDGVAGDGDGDFEDGDDDGLVGINSQQMGYRLTYTEGGWFKKSGFSEDKAMGYVANLNAPNETQSTSYSSVLPYDHVDVCGLGVIPYLIGDSFDETRFYADLIDFIADKE
ncbi:hypothetical protein JCM14469_37020 [Desulfatiferula olefinivorans]